jgi:hypothetical protein
MRSSLLERGWLVSVDAVYQAIEVGHSQRRQQSGYGSVPGLPQVAGCWLQCGGVLATTGRGVSYDGAGCWLRRGGV